jgi:hypothetical protein
VGPPNGRSAGEANSTKRARILDLIDQAFAAGVAVRGVEASCFIVGHEQAKGWGVAFSGSSISRVAIRGPVPVLHYLGYTVSRRVDL